MPGVGVEGIGLVSNATTAPKDSLTIEDIVVSSSDAEVGGSNAAGASAGDDAGGISGSMSSCSTSFSSSPVGSSPEPLHTYLPSILQYPYDGVIIHYRSLCASASWSSHPLD